MNQRKFIAGFIGIKECRAPATLRYLASEGELLDGPLGLSEVLLGVPHLQLVLLDGVLETDKID